jgi:hypothetical protein
MNTNTNTNARADATVLSAEAFAHLGDGRIAYVKPIRSEDVKNLFPNAPELQAGMQLFALHSASGAPIMITDTREAAVASAFTHELETVSLH